MLMSGRATTSATIDDFPDAGPGRAAATGAVSRRRVLAGSAGALLAAAGGGLVTACGGGESASGRTAVTFLTIVPLTSLTFAPELMADAGGYFADSGLDVSFQATRGSAQAIQLVLAGGAPITRIGQVEAVGHAAKRDAPLLNVATVVKESTIRFVSSPANPLREPRDFLGKVMGIPSEGGESETTLDLLLNSAGLDPESVERQVVGLGPGVYNLVEQGRIAGFIVSMDTAMILQRQVPGLVVLRPGDFVESGSQCYMVSRDHLAENEDIVRRYLEAVGGAIDFMIGDEGFGETLRIMRQKYSFGTLLDDEVAKGSLAEYVRSWTGAGDEYVMRTDPVRWRAGYDELVRAGQVPGGLDPSEWFTNDYAPAR